ncbi:unnamed protein product, partial [marine sediment metagenome]
MIVYCPRLHAASAASRGRYHFDAARDDVTEIVSARTRCAKKFDNHDGTYQYIVSAGPLHYQNDDGWQEIDTTIRASSLDDADYEMTKSLYKAFFNKTFNRGPIVRLIKDGHSVAIRPGDLCWINDRGVRQLIATPQPSEGRAHGNVITYEDAYGPN